MDIRYSQRKGNTVDYTPERRIDIFETYHEMKDRHTQRQICDKLGIHQAVFSSIKLRSKWWKDLEAERRNEE